MTVFDLTKNSSDISSPLYVGFNVTKTSLTNFKNMGSNITNASGSVIFSFLPDGDFTSGERRWFGSVDTATSTCYNSIYTQNFSVTLTITVGNAYPRYYNETVNGVTSGYTAGWGGQWNFSISVNDTEGDDLNISLQVNTTGIYQEIGRANCSACSGAAQQFNFTYTNFSCANINPSAQYRFLVSDNSSNTNTTTLHTFTVEKDDVIFEHVLGNDSIANRSGSQIDVFKLRVYDTDNATYTMNLTNITFSVMRDGVTWGAGALNTTNTSGDVIFNFDSTCSPRYEVGSRNWKAEVLSSTCYKDAVSSIFDLTIIGDIASVLTKPKYNYESGGQNFTQEQTISFLGSSVDDCGTALTLNITLAAEEIKFYGIHPEITYNCTQGIELVGSNAYFGSISDYGDANLQSRHMDSPGT